MTVNIFENGGEFCTRADADKAAKDPTFVPRAVEWHAFSGISPDNKAVAYANQNGSIFGVNLDGLYFSASCTDYRDLLPLPPRFSVSTDPIGVLDRQRPGMILEPPKANFTIDERIQECVRWAAVWNDNHSKPDSYIWTPIQTPPVYIPWDSPDDVPEPCWIRNKTTLACYLVVGFETDGIAFNGMFSHWRSIFEHCEWHTDRKAKTGWLPCGKFVQK